MNKKIKYGLIVFPIIILSLLLLIMSNYFKTGFKSNNGKSVALVNGEKIKASDFTKRYEARKNYYIEKAGDDSFLDQASGKNDLTIDEYIKKTVLDEMVDYKIIEEDSKKLGIEVDSKIVDKKFADLKKDLSDKFKDEQKKLGVKDSFYKDKIMEQEFLKAHEKKVKGSFEIKDEELKNYYEEHKNEYYLAKVSHILLKTEEEANQVYGELSENNFGELAKKYSKDQNSKESNGFLGEFKSGIFEESVDEEIKKLNAGQISKPVKSKLGYHIIRVDEKKVQPFSDVKDSIKTEILNNKYQEYLKALKDKAEVKINLEDIKS